MDQDHIVAIGLLTEQDLRVLGPTFTRAWPVDDAPAFSDLIQAIDEADEELRRAKLDEAANRPSPRDGPLSLR